MKEIKLDSIKSPKDLKILSSNQLQSLAKQIRENLVSNVKVTGGHLASNLGIVELTIAMHAVLDSPKDKIIWDVAHQCYVHKMLTGRLDKMPTLRQHGGISGFTKITESEHDIFGAGHASTSISAALGIAEARDLKKEDFSVVSVFGDGSLSGGMMFEALNNAGQLKTNFVCILNDNDMAISAPIGSMAKYITKMRTSTVYNAAKNKFERVIEKIPKIGVPLLNRIEHTVDRIRDIVLDFKFGVIFEEFGFRYIGPIDGHNIPMLMAALRYSKNYNGPIIIHVLTKKGKGYAPAEENPTEYHGVSPAKKRESELKMFSQVFGDELVRLAKADDKIVAITPAMKEGSGLVEFAEKFPKRFFDVGIAEEHAVTFAAGLARNGIKPVLAIYSTFLQRGYDQLIHDVCLQNLGVVFAIDRAGLVGEDGPTHHGTFDIAMMLHIPNLTILAPKDGDELGKMLEWATKQHSPIALRYPKGLIPEQNGKLAKAFSKPAMEVMLEPQKKDKFGILIIGVGTFAWTAYEVARKLKKAVTVINLRAVKPIDKRLKGYIENAKETYVIEEGTSIGGVYSYILQTLKPDKPIADIKQIALPDEFIEHGSNKVLREKYKLSEDKIYNFILKHSGN